MPTKTAPPKPIDQRAESVTMIPIERVHPAPDNPRQDLGDLAELVESIRAQGILQPLVVTPDGYVSGLTDAYMVVIGHRRLAAAKVLQSAHVPCIVRPYDERGRQEAMVVENLQRVDLTALEEARAFKRLVELGLSQRDVAERVGRSQAHVSKRLSLLQLPGRALTLIAKPKDGLLIADALQLTDFEPEVIESALDQFERAQKDPWNRQHFSLVRTAEQIKSDLERQRRKDAEIERLTKAGIRLVATDKYGHPVSGRLVGLGRGYGELPIKIAEHRKLPCHGAYVSNQGTAIEGCDNPATHAKAEDKAVAKVAREYASAGRGRASGNEEAKKKAAEARQRNKDLRAVAPVRAKAIAGLLSGKPKKEQVLDFVLLQLLQRVIDETSGPAEVAGKWLEVPKGLRGRSWSSYLAIGSAGFSDRLLKAAYAVCLAMGEDPISLLPERGHFNGEFLTSYQRFLAHLEDNGYRPEKAERDQAKHPANAYGWRPAIEGKGPKQGAIPAESAPPGKYPAGTCSLDAGPACSEHESALQRVAAVPA